VPNRPVPTALKLLAGNPGKRKLNEAEPQYEVAAPPMPSGLPPAAVQEWDRIVPQLVASRVITRVDRAALTAYVLAWQRLLDAEAEIQAHGILVPVLVEDETGQYVSSGNYKKNPAVTVQNEAKRNVRAFAVEFGMSPASRTKVKSEGPEQDADPLGFLDSDNSLTATH
jgi:P27 family predicted phage terminase small subunit